MYTNDEFSNALYDKLCEKSNNRLKKEAALRISRYMTKRLQKKDRQFDVKQVADNYATKLLPTIKAENFKTDIAEVSVDRRTGKQMYRFFKSHYETLSDHQFLRIVIGETGYDFEEYFAWAIKAFSKYKQVRVTPTRGDFGIDIIAIAHDGRRIGFQTKRYSNKVQVKAVQETISGKAYYNLDEVYIATNADLTKPAYIMADKIGVKYILGGNMLTVLKSLA